MIELCPCCNQPRPEVDATCRRLRIAEIQAHVAGYYGFPISEMKSDRRAREVVRPRQVAMYLSKRLTPSSLPEIGRLFGGRDHTTVIHAVRQIENLCRIDAEMGKDVGLLSRELEAMSAIAAVPLG